jgi:hypothetical protein
MVRQATLFRVVATLLIALGVAAVLPLVDALPADHIGHGRAKSGETPTLPASGANPTSWVERGEHSELSLLATSAVSAFIVLVALLVAIVIYRNRKKPM